MSKGNAQKVALAQALLEPPQLLVLDEPWSGLDTTAHSILRELLTETAREGGAVAFTEHSDHVVKSTATRICEIRHGRLLQLSSSDSHQVTEIELLAGADIDWSRHHGVIEARRHGAGGTLILPTGIHGIALLTALNHGWSVTSVRQVKRG